VAWALVKPAWLLAGRDRFIGWSSPQRHAICTWYSTITVFCCCPECTAPYLASRVLGLICRRLAADWFSHYGYRPVLLETFVQLPRFTGTARRTANWRYGGLTKGRGKLEKLHQAILPQKAIFLYPLRPDFQRYSYTWSPSVFTEYLSILRYKFLQINNIHGEGRTRDLLSKTGARLQSEDGLFWRLKELL
jgi:hypothetical protein